MPAVSARRSTPNVEPDDGGDLEQAARVTRKAIDAAGDDRAHALGAAETARARARRPSANRRAAARRSRRGAATAHRAGRDCRRSARTAGERHARTPRRSAHPAAASTNAATPSSSKPVTSTRRDTFEPVRSPPARRRRRHSHRHAPRGASRRSSSAAVPRCGASAGGAGASAGPPTAGRRARTAPARAAPASTSRSVAAWKRAARGSWPNVRSGPLSSSGSACSRRARPFRVGVVDAERRRRARAGARSASTTGPNGGPPPSRQAPNSTVPPLRGDMPRELGDEPGLARARLPSYEHRVPATVAAPRPTRGSSCSHSDGSRDERDRRHGAQRRRQLRSRIAGSGIDDVASMRPRTRRRVRGTPSSTSGCDRAQRRRSVPRERGGGRAHQARCSAPAASHSRDASTTVAPNTSSSSTVTSPGRDADVGGECVAVPRCISRGDGLLDA